MKTENEDYDENTGLGIYGNGTDKPDAPNETTAAAATKATHTAQNWEQRAETDGRTVTHYLKIGSGNCYLTRGVGQTNEEVRANARLIAAAPDMLDALYRTLEFAPNEIEANRIRFVIAKATGATS